MKHCERQQKGLQIIGRASLKLNDQSHTHTWVLDLELKKSYSKPIMTM